jgi:hypothetical protein
MWGKDIARSIDYVETRAVSRRPFRPAHGADQGIADLAGPLPRSRGVGCRVVKVMFS